MEKSSLEHQKKKWEEFPNSSSLNFRPHFQFDKYWLQQPPVSSQNVKGEGNL